jgi:NAD(P)-dependent dehydrogenase (short-subunit alcohol dehydrogenase family)
MGATVILASRTKSKTLEVAEEIRKANPDSKGHLVVEQALDTSDLDSVVEFAR